MRLDVAITINMANWVGSGKAKLGRVMRKGPGRHDTWFRYWVLIQGAIFTVSIVISGLLSLPSCYLGNEVGKKA